MVRLFNKCVDVVLSHEGGYVNHPSDPGGETNFGICKKYFPDEDIKNMTVERAKELYYLKYWLPMNLFGIEDEMAVLHIFDHGVNAGRYTAIRMAQRIAGVKEDGLCGPITRAGVNGYRGNFVKMYMEARKTYYNDLVERKPELNIFLRGWINRVNRTKFR